MSTKTDTKEFESWLKQPETQHLEFKTAKNSFSKDKDLPDYCAALANEGGGKLVLGVDPARRVFGTNAFTGSVNKLPHDLLVRLGIKVEIEELHYNGSRVLIFHVPSRHPGQVVISKGHYTYPMRAGESLVEMDQATLRKILTEHEPDYSAKIVKDLKVEDLDKEAIDKFRKKWSQKSGRQEYLKQSDDKILRAANILTDKGINYAGLILFGRAEKISELLPGAELIFEWRRDDEAIPYDFRTSWKEPFFKIYDEVWQAINARNSRFPLQEGLFQGEILAFNEKSIREALLNAVAHRDYSITGRSIFIRASSGAIIIESPGGFPGDVTSENVLNKTCWRNRRIAETFEKAGFVERSGQGMDDIFANTIKEGKGLPDLSKTSNDSVVLKIPAQVLDGEFIVFLEKIQAQKGTHLSFEEIYELEEIREKQTVTNPEFKEKFLSLGIIEKIGKTKGSKYIISHKYYHYKKKPGIYTRLMGVGRDKQKELIIKHLVRNKTAKRSEFHDIFPELQSMDVSNLLQELKREKRIRHKGSSKDGYWELLK